MAMMTPVVDPVGMKENWSLKHNSVGWFKDGDGRV